MTNRKPKIYYRSILITVRFLTPCLASKDSRDGIKRFDKVDGTPVFMESWFTKALCDGARRLNMDVRTAKEARFKPEVQGDLGVYEKRAKRGKAFKHECFPSGSEVTLSASFPRRIALADIERLLMTVGEYVGISPFGHVQGFGKFQVEQLRTSGEDANAVELPEDRAVRSRISHR